MPENAIVAIIEDDPGWGERIKEKLEDAGHSVVGPFISYAEAMQAIPTFKDIGVQAVTLDENLTKSETSGVDGESLLQEIREQAPGVKVISVAARPRAEADATVDKAEYNQVSQLGAIVTRI